MFQLKHRRFELCEEILDRLKVCWAQLVSSHLISLPKQLLEIETNFFGCLNIVYMEDKILRNTETKHHKCLIQSVELLQIFHNIFGLILSPHGDSVEAFRPQMDHHFGLLFKIIEWDKQ